MTGRRVTLLGSLGLLCSGVGLGAPTRAGSQQLGPNLAKDSVATPQAFGAKADGLADDTAAIRAALAALADGGTLHFPPGIYLISEEIDGPSNVAIVGTEATILSRTVMRSFFYFRDKANVSVRGCAFDMNASNLPVYDDQTVRPKNVAIFFDVGCTNVSVAGNTFKNLYTNALRFYRVSRAIDVRENHFSSALQQQMLALEHIHILTCLARISICNNSFSNAATQSPASVPGGIFLSGTKGSVIVDGNVFDYCGRDNTGHHRVGVVDFYGNSENVTVTRNVSTNTMGSFLRLNDACPAEVAGNTIERSAWGEPGGNTVLLASTIQFLTTGRVGMSDVTIHDNSFTAAADQDAGVVVQSYDYSTPSRNIRVHDNSFNNFKFAVQVGGPFENVSIVGNTIGGNTSACQIRALFTGHNVEIGAANKVTQAEAVFQNLTIRGNVIATPDPSSVPIVVDYSTATAFRGVIGQILIHQNIVSAIKASTVSAISASGPQLPTGDVSVRGNVVSRFAVAFYMRSLGRVTIAGNDTRDITKAIVVQSGNKAYREI